MVVFRNDAGSSFDSPCNGFDPVFSAASVASKITTFAGLGAVIAFVVKIFAKSNASEADVKRTTPKRLDTFSAQLPLRS